jgi:IS30 family transposase
MRRIGHRFVSAIERLELWQRWREGEPIVDIARSLGRGELLVRQVLVARGGIAPKIARRSPHALSGPEREEISRGLARGWSLRRIAVQLNRQPSTVSREVRRNGGRGCYRASAAEVRARSKAARPKLCKLAQYPRLCRLVAARLKRFWSPEQIAAWLKLQYRGRRTMQVSHETIYQSLFVQARGVLKAELLDCLRSKRRLRHARSSKRVERRGTIPDLVSIRHRPAEAEDRAVPGHWEGDLLVGTQTSFIATLVERASRFVLLVKVPSSETSAVVEALIKQARKLPGELRRSLTWDRGHELKQHKRFTLATDMKVYFCDPRSPWQRGTNENTNALLRQYFPKGEDVSHYTQAELNRVARELNQRPRKTLRFQTPAYALEEALR